jgi:CRP-like cAMP-binding protein
MKPTAFSSLANEHGTLEKYTVGQVFHAQDFPNKLFLLKSGYVKRYQATNPEQKVLELIYGPDHIVSLSQLYKTLFGVNQNQENLIYIYQAMTDVEMLGIDADIVLAELDKNPELYRDFFYESGLKLRSNISRLASNSIKDDYKKVAHQLVSLAYEFAGIHEGDIRKTVDLPLPQSPTDMAEQLNISNQVVEAVLNSLEKNSIIKIANDNITILDIELLKDIYL